MTWKDLHQAAKVGYLEGKNWCEKWGDHCILWHIYIAWSLLPAALSFSCQPWLLSQSLHGCFLQSVQCGIKTTQGSLFLLRVPWFLRLRSPAFSSSFSFPCVATPFAAPPAGLSFCPHPCSESFPWFLPRLPQDPLWNHAATYWSFPPPTALLPLKESFNPCTSTSPHHLLNKLQCSLAVVFTGLHCVNSSFIPWCSHSNISTPAPIWAARAHVFELSSIAFPGKLAGCWVRSRIARTWTRTPIWDAIIATFDLILHVATPALKQWFFFFNQHSLLILGMFSHPHLSMEILYILHSVFECH